MRFYLIAATVFVIDIYIMIKRANVNYCKNLFRKYAADAIHPATWGLLQGTLGAGAGFAGGSLIGVLYNLLKTKTQEQKKHRIKSLLRDALIGGGIGASALGLGLGLQGYLSGNQLNKNISSLTEGNPLTEFFTGDAADASYNAVKTLSKGDTPLLLKLIGLGTKPPAPAARAETSGGKALQDLGGVVGDLAGAVGNTGSALWHGTMAAGKGVADLADATGNAVTGLFK